MNFPRHSLPDLAPAYPSQPYSQHDEYQNVPPAQQSCGPYRVDQTSAPASTWQTQPVFGPAATTQHHIQQPFGPRVLYQRDAPFESGSASYSQPTSTSTSTLPAALAPPVGLQEQTRKRKAPTLRAADWEPYKKRILDLHIEQDLPLPEVKQMMQNECGFEAEVRQYRSCITKWGKDKNVKLEEMQAIVRKRQERNLTEPHKRGLVFEVRGNEVDRQKIERWMKRHNASNSFLYAPSPAASTPSAVDYHTERGSPAPTTITVYSSAPSPDGTFTAQSSELQSTTLSLTGILRSPVDEFPEHSSILGPQSLPNLDLSFIYSLSDSESIMNRSVQILYKKEEEKRWLSKLIIADLAIPGDPWEIMRTLSRLGRVLKDQGRYNAAEDVACKLIECHRSRLGDSSDDAEMLYAMTLLVDILYFQCSYVRAETLCFRTMKGKGVLARKDPSGDIIVNNLVRVAKKLNKLEEAESVSRHAIEEATQIHGPKHGVTLDLMTELGSVLGTQKRYKEAEAMLSNTLALSEEVLGLEDHLSLWVMDLLVELFVNQNRYDEAEQLQRRSLSIAKKALGPEEEMTLFKMASLSDILENQGRYEEAEALLRETLILCKKVYGPEHPYTLKHMNDLGSRIRKQGRYKEAEAVFRKTMISRKKVLGPEHPATLETMTELGAVLGDQGRYAEAEAVFREATVLSKNLLGHKHPDTLNSIGWLRLVLEYQGRFEEAESVS